MEDRPAVRTGKSAQPRDYLVRLDAERRLIMIVHGNSDAGGCVLNWMLQRATLVHVQDLQHHPLTEVLRVIISSDTPNTWGLS